jgi:hypothetical protein
MALAGQFDRPIPGESLTGEPKNNPWEQPPEMAELSQVTKYYINKLANQDVIDDFAAMCQAGAPLKPIVQSITQQGMLRGLHTVDAAMLVNPIIHQFLKQAIESMGIEVDDDGRDMQAEAEAAEMNRFLVLATKYLRENPDDMQDPGKQLIEELVEETKEEEPEQDKPKGLMARG